MDKSYDLLSVKNKTFYVKFDTLTPRPHFIILPKNQANIEYDFSKMTQEKRKELMEVVQSMMNKMSSTYNTSEGILSIHRGSWLSKVTYEFHAHLCVDVNPYLKVFENEKHNIPCSAENWPYMNYVNPTSYPSKVSCYPSKSYHTTEVKEIEKLQFTQPRDLPKVDNMKVILHRSHPKIGFVGTKTIPLANVVWAIEKFAHELDLTTSNWADKKCYYDGCHVCLYLGSGKFIYTAYFVR
jgi:diadenosine tetraphosphate (Ap4A) HIT family hydrolase